MAKFLHYLDPKNPVEHRLEYAFYKEHISREHEVLMMAFLQPIKAKDLPTYEHSIRAGLLARRIGEFVHLDPKALLYAGLLHDIGKAQTRLATLQKTEGWTQADTEKKMSPVINCFHLLLH